MEIPTDVTLGEGILAAVGLPSHELLAAVSSDDSTNTVNSFGTVQWIEIGMGLGRTHHVSYVGGWSGICRKD